MISKQLLDYEVFEILKNRIESQSDFPIDQFTEQVLGYGFLPQFGKNDPVHFAILCSPSSTESLRELLNNVLSEGLLELDSIHLLIKVLSTAQSKPLNRIYEHVGEGKQGKVSVDLTQHVRITLGQTLRQVILKEHRKVLLPAYLLRYTPFTSPNLIILRAALGQIHYLHNSGNQLLDNFEQSTVTAKMSEISYWTSLSRTSIYRLLHDDPQSEWLIGVENRGSFQNKQGQQISLPNEYLLHPLRLTPGDATDLFSFLKASSHDWEDIESLLISLSKINRREIFEFPYRTPRLGDFENPATILEIITKAIGPFELTAERLQMLEQARDNLIGTDFVAVSWYVFRNLLPVYGSSIITLFLMCQPLLFNNGSIKRNTFWLPGGSETLYAWTTDRSIAKYFPKRTNKGRGRPKTKSSSSDQTWRANKRELLSDFFLRIDTRKDAQNGKAWQIQVNDPPVLSSDEKLMTDVYSLLANLIENDQLEGILTLFDHPIFNPPEEKILIILDRLYRAQISPASQSTLDFLAEQIISNIETPDIELFSDFETPVERLISIFGTPVQEIFSKSETPATTLISKIETYLKILFLIKDSIDLLKDSSYQQDSNPIEETHPTTAAVGWEITEMLEEVSQEYKQKILTSKAQVNRFKAWLVHSALNPGVNQPLNLAISQTLRGKTPPSQAAVRLAQMPENVIVKLLTKFTDNPTRMGYRQDSEIQSALNDLQLLLVGVDPAKKSSLVRRLLDLVVSSGGNQG